MYFFVLLLSLCIFFFIFAHLRYALLYVFYSIFKTPLVNLIHSTAIIIDRNVYRFIYLCQNFVRIRLSFFRTGISSSLLLPPSLCPIKKYPTFGRRKQKILTMKRSKINDQDQWCVSRIKFGVIIVWSFCFLCATTCARTHIHKDTHTMRIHGILRIHNQIHVKKWM